MSRSFLRSGDSETAQINQEFEDKCSPAGQVREMIRPVDPEARKARGRFQNGIIWNLKSEEDANHEVEEISAGLILKGSLPARIADQAFPFARLPPPFFAFDGFGGGIAGLPGTLPDLL